MGPQLLRRAAGHQQPCSCQVWILDTSIGQVKPGVEEPTAIDKVLEVRSTGLFTWCVSSATCHGPQKGLQSSILGWMSAVPLTRLWRYASTGRLLPDGGLWTRPESPVCVREELAGLVWLETPQLEV